MRTQWLALLPFISPAVRATPRLPSTKLESPDFRTNARFYVACAEMLLALSRFPLSYRLERKVFWKKR